ncbi:MAG: cache domain-containing protein [Alphaproteobacteria bacterium]|nr:cache domain-containing protein [Alphaproteobacteria bacterium]
MKNYWTQPSLSRDFALLSAAVFCVLFMVSMWITYVTYSAHTQRIATELQTEADRIEMTLGSEMENANYLLTALGRQIVVNNARDLVELAQILKSYDAKGQMYAVFNWINVDQKIIVSSNRGILDKPVDVSDRDFVKKAFVDPWKMHIGRPIEGRVSGRWVIPVAMGLTDYTGRFIGTLIISLDISELTERVSTLVKRDGISFAIISKTLIPLTQVSEDKDFLDKNFPAQTLVNIDYVKNPSGLLSQGSMFLGTGNYNYYAVSNDYPYIILMGYDNHYQDDAVRNMLWSRLLQMLVIAAFFILFLIVVRNRMIRPIMQVTEAIAQVARGNTDVRLPTVGPIEIGALATQVSRVREYIEEHKRVDDELRNKMFMLRRQAKEMEVSKHSKAEFLAFICQEMRAPVNSAMGCAQVMKDQIYGPIENKKYRQYASDIYASCSHLISQLDYVLELAKIEAHYAVLRESTIELPATITHAVESLGDPLRTADILVKTEFENPALLFFADEFRIQQLISNALLYAIEQGLSACTVTIAVKTVMEKKDRQNVEISVTIPAIPAEEGTFSTHLELIKRLAELHQGSMSITSEQLTITLPGTRLRFAD